MKDKRLRHVAFLGNPFVEEVEGYRIWIISNNAKIVDVDGEKSTRHVELEAASSARPPPTHAYFVRRLLTRFSPDVW